MEKPQLIPRDVLVRVDVQNDFVSGSLRVPRGAEVVRPLNDVARLVRENGGTVVDTRDWHPRQTPHFDKWPVHCVQHTHGADFHPGLERRCGDIVLSKGMKQTDGYSGAEGIELGSGRTLESLIRPMKNDERSRVMLGGLATDYCVRATMLDITRMFRRDRRVTTFLIRDAVRGVNMSPGDELRALREMEAAGAIALTSDEIKRTFFEG